MSECDPIRTEQSQEKPKCLDPAGIQIVLGKRLLVQKLLETLGVQTPVYYPVQLLFGYFDLAK